MQGQLSLNRSTAMGGGAPASSAADARRRAGQRVRRERKAPRDPGRGWRSVALIVAGATLSALSFNLLLRAGGIPSGGAVGVSLLVERLAGWPPAVVQWTLNLGLLAVCGVALGRRFVLKSVAGSLLVPLVVLLTGRFAPLTTNPLLAAVCGGAGLGAGLGLVYRGNGSIGGFSGVALWLHRARGWPVDRVMIALDGTVVALTAWWLGAEVALHAALCIFVTGRVAKAVMTGFNNAKVATIISPRAAEIREVVVRDVPLGVTTLAGRGGYTGREQEVLMVVMTPSELMRFKTVVREQDPNAFMIVSDAAEVLGHGFAPHR